MRPRMGAGETSATYIGESKETPPTASPPRNRATTNPAKLGASAVATEVTAKSSATHTTHTPPHNNTPQQGGPARAPRGGNQKKPPPPPPPPLPPISICQFAGEV